MASLPREAFRLLAFALRSIEMKTRLIFAACSACLLMLAGNANSQQTQQEPQQPAAQATLQQDANMSAQSSTDTSYGGMPDTRSATSSQRNRRCATGPNCDIFFGQ
jgi:hypothetical protein